MTKDQPEDAAGDPDEGSDGSDEEAGAAQPQVEVAEVNALCSGTAPFDVGI